MASYFLCLICKAANLVMTSGGNPVPKSLEGLQEFK